MTPDLYWIPGSWTGKLAIAARPRGMDWLDDELRDWRRAGVHVVVSLLEKHEANQLGLSTEGETAESHGLRFIAFPIPDLGVPPSISRVHSLLHEITTALQAGRNVAIHCRQGIGRSGLIAAATLMSAGIEMETAVDIVSAARGLRVPETPEQLDWLRHSLVHPAEVAAP